MPKLRQYEIEVDMEEGLPDNEIPADTIMDYEDCDADDYPEEYEEPYIDLNFLTLLWDR